MEYIYLFSRKKGTTKRAYRSIEALIDYENFDNDVLKQVKYEEDNYSHPVLYSDVFCEISKVTLD